MRRIVAVIFALACVPPASNAIAAPAVIHHDLVLIYVEPAGETFTIADQAYARAEVEAAMRWWEELSPTALTLTITSTTPISTSADFVYNDPGDFALDHAPLPLAEHTLVVFVVDNQESGRGFYDGMRAVTWPGYAAFLTLSSPLTAIATHEFGHLIFSLPDLYHQLPCDFGIMCDELEAYTARQIGCDSLALLGHPCHRVWLPTVGQRPWRALVRCNRADLHVVPAILECG